MKSTLLLALLFNLCTTFGLQKINGTGSKNVTCDETVTACKISCIGDGDDTCGDNTSNGYDGSNLYCPTTTDCEYCEIYCNGDSACQGSTIYSYYCNTLNITLDGSETDPGEKMTIYAPGNGGSLIVDMIDSDTDSDTFRDSVIYASNEMGGTGSIILNCRDCNGDDECANVHIDARSAKYLEINCFSNTECDNMEIYCPEQTLSNSVDNLTGCKITCIDTDECDMDIYVPGNQWSDNLNFICDDTDCEGAVVLCDDGSCTISGTNECGGDECQNTMIPTNLPTTIPTSQPSIIPTDAPSNAPIVPTIAMPSYAPVVFEDISTTNNFNYSMETIDSNSSDSTDSTDSGSEDESKTGNNDDIFLGLSMMMLIIIAGGGGVVLLLCIIGAVCLRIQHQKNQQKALALQNAFKRASINQKLTKLEKVSSMSEISTGFIGGTMMMSPGSQSSINEPNMFRSTSDITPGGPGGPGGSAGGSSIPFDSNNSDDNIDNIGPSSANPGGEGEAGAEMNMATPGGPDGDNNTNNNDNNNGRRESVEMGVALAELLQEKERVRARSRHEMNERDSKFGKMLGDKLMATDVIEDEIVNSIDNDKNGTTTTGTTQGFTPGY